MGDMNTAQNPIPSLSLDPIEADTIRAARDRESWTEAEQREFLQTLDQVARRHQVPYDTTLGEYLRGEIACTGRDWETLTAKYSVLGMRPVEIPRMSPFDAFVSQGQAAAVQRASDAQKQAAADLMRRLDRGESCTPKELDTVRAWKEWEDRYGQNIRAEF